MIFEEVLDEPNQAYDEKVFSGVQVTHKMTQPAEIPFVGESINVARYHGIQELLAIELGLVWRFAL